MKQVYLLKERRKRVQGKLGYFNHLAIHSAHWGFRMLALCILAVAPFLSSSAQTPLNENEVYNRIMSLQYQSKYAEGAPWDNSYITYNKVEFFGYPANCYGGAGCFAFMMEVMEYASNYEYPIRCIEATTFEELPQIHIGDGLRLDYDSHSVVVIGVNGSVVTVAEGNYNSSVHWGREIDLSDPGVGLTHLATFYPEEPTYDLGDVNHDGRISVTDVVTLVSYLLSEQLSNFYEENADIDGNGIVEQSDIQPLVTMVLTMDLSYAPEGSFDSSFDNLYMLSNGNSYTLCMNSHETYLGCQMRLTLPEGCSLQEAKLSSENSNHKMAIKNNGKGEYSVLVYTSGNQELSLNDEPLLNFVVNGRHSSSDIQVTDVQFVNSQLETVMLPDVSGAVTGIMSVNSFDNTNAPAYNMQGIRVDSSSRGLIISGGKKIFRK